MESRKPFVMQISNHLITKNHTGQECPKHKKKEHIQLLSQWLLKALRAAFEAQDNTRSLAPNTDLDYRTSSIFVNNKVWAKLDTKEHKATFLIEKIQAGLHHRLQNMTQEMEAAMRERAR